MTTFAPQPTVGTGEVDAATVRRWLTSGEAVLVDVREPDEHAREAIAGARLVPLSRFDPGAAAAPAKVRLVLHCKSGRRSAEAATRMAAAGFSAMCLKGGIDAWKAAGLPTVARRLPIPIMRQVQIVAGGTVLAASILAALVSPWFLLLTGFFGAGLLFSGVSGTCGMAAVLGLMPWNRGFRAAAPVASTPGRDGCCSGESSCQKGDAR